MPPDSDARTSRHRIATRGAVTIWAAAGALVLVIGIALLWSRSSSESGPTPGSSTASLAEEAGAFQRPADWEPYRPAIHLTPAENWMNDPQKPFFLDGVWHYYYLYNADYPDGNGTAWYHTTSTDLVHWEDQGVAIEKYTNGLGDIWTGTAVIDHNDTAGFGAGAVIALVTQQTDGVQRQSLFFSRDGGYTFESYEGNPVMDNPGVADWRDPRVIWDDERDRWVMALAEGDTIGFYGSPDLRSWTYLSAFAAPDLGVTECPDVFRMSVDGDPTNVRWVLVAGVNGASEEMTTGTVYWTGDWDGREFTPDGEHEWLDRGADYYAAVTWDDPRLTDAERLAQRYSIAWLNNWSYAGDQPTEQWHGGSDTIIRTIRLVETGGRFLLRSMPLDELRTLEGPQQTLDVTTVQPDDGLALPDPGSDAYRVTVELEAGSAGGEVRIVVPRGPDGAFATVGYNLARGTAFVARDVDGIADDMPDTYRAVRTVAVAPREGIVRLDIVVDVASVEVFVNDGEASLSMVTVGSADAQGLRIEAMGSAVVVAEATVIPLRVAPVRRAAAE